MAKAQPANSQQATNNRMIQPILKRHDSAAYGVIATLSVVVFAVVVALGKFKLLSIGLGFDPHIFARANAYINSIVALLLIYGLILVRQRKYEQHRNVMLTAFAFSSLFLVSYILHHLLTADTHFGGEGMIRYIYFPLLITHIALAATILPFILLTTYRGLTSDFKNHKKIARITYPIWLYVSISGVIVYLLIAPYYSHL
jgi:putative membrane protein